MKYAAYIVNDEQRLITVFDGVFNRRKNALSWGLSQAGRLYIVPVRNC